MNGRTSDWFRGTQRRHEGMIRSGGVEKEVTFVEADGHMEGRIDDAYREKYRPYARSIVDSVLTREARASTPQARASMKGEVPYRALESADPLGRSSEIPHWRLPEETPSRDRRSDDCTSW